MSDQPEKPAVEPIARVVLEFNPRTSHLDVKGECPTLDLALEMVRRAEFSLMQQIEAAKQPRVAGAPAGVLSMLDAARRKGGLQS